MRLFAISFLIVAAAPMQQLKLVSLISPLKVVTAQPRVDGETALKLDGGALGGVAWDFGDGTTGTGGAAVTHRYGKAGTFTGKATRGGNTAQVQVTVTEPRHLVITPETILPGQKAALRLDAAFASALQWNFGDGSPVQSGPAQVEHVFAKAGTYQVTVRDLIQDFPRTFEQSVGVGLQGAGAPFSISYMALRWEDGGADRTVTTGAKDLVAYADLKFEGTGQLQAQWVVDGQVQRSVSQQLNFAKTATLGSGRSGLVKARTSNTFTLATSVAGEYQISLPTNVPGEHTVTLKVSQPKLAFQVPVIRYFVKLAGAPQGPSVQSVSPASVKPGEEAELTLTGSGFSAGMSLNLGKEITLVGPLRILSPEKALAKVFVAPSAAAGARTLQALKAGSGAAGTARLEVVPRLGFSRAAGAVVPPGGTPSQVLSGVLPGNKPPEPPTPLKPGAPAFAKAAAGAVLGASDKPAGILAKVGDEKPAGGLAKIGDTRAGLGLTKAEDGKGAGGLKAGVGKVLGGLTKAGDSPSGIRFTQTPPRVAPALDLTKVTKVTPGFARFEPGVKAVVDGKGAARKERVIACVEGQKLKLTDITLKAPVFQRSGASEEEFEILPPLLRDSTQFVWSEKNPGAAEYFELRIHDAKDGALLRTVKLNGGTSTFNVTPAFLQDLGRRDDQHTLQTNVGTAAPSTAIASTKGDGAARPGGSQRAVVGRGAVSAKASAASSSPAVSPQASAIPANLRKFADLVWQVVGFRSFPCLAPEDMPAEAPIKLVPGFTKAVTTALGGPEAPTGLKSVLTKSGGSPLAGSVQTILAAGQPSGTDAKPRRGMPAAKAGSSGLPSLQQQMGSTATAAVANAADLQAKDQPKVYKTMVAEVSRSDFWPLRQPVTAQGVKPGMCTIGSQNLTVVIESDSKSTKSGGQTSQGESRYVHDVIRLHGTFDLGQNVPYRLIPSMIKSQGGAGGWGSGGVGGAIGAAISAAASAGAPAAQNATASVEEVAFKNVFVDWGDGTVEPFRGRPLDPVMAGGPDYNGRYVIEKGAFQHVYRRASEYMVKVFVLSDEDMVRSGLVGDVSKALTPSDGLAGAFHRLNGATLATGAPLLKVSSALGRTEKSGVKSSVSPSAAVGALGTAPGITYLQGPPSASQALSRAFAVYCEPNKIVPRKDPCANGPLHLVSTELEFPKEAAAPRNPQLGVQAAARDAAMAPRKPPTPGLPTPAVPKLAVGTLPPGTPSIGGAKPNLPGVGIASAGSGARTFETAPVPVTTPCNLAYIAKTRVRFYGNGTLRVVWKVDGKQVGSREDHVMSKERANLTETQSQACRDPLISELLVNTPALPVDAIGQHRVTVEAHVVASKSADLTDADLTHLVQLSQGVALGGAPSPQLAQTLVDAVGRGGTKVALGLLNPSQGAGQPAFISLHKAGALATGLGLSRQVGGALAGVLQQGPPYRVETTAAYEVKPAEEGKVCTFFFPVKDGLFPVTNLSNLKLTPEGGLQRASGKGSLLVKLRSATAPDAVGDSAVEVSFSNWLVEGVTVTQGAFNVSANQPYLGPGVKGTLKQVEATVKDKNAPEDLQATLSLHASDPTITLVKDSVTQTPWEAKAPLTPQGDWIVKGLTLPKSNLGATPWSFSATEVTIDLSAKEGADPKGGKTPDWTGVHLGTVTVEPSTLGISGGAWAKPLPQPKDWTMEGGVGVVGKLDTGPWSVEYGKGGLAIGNIAFTGRKDGTYTAKYADMVVRTPWFKEPIKGNGKWIRMANGEYQVCLDELQAGKRPTLAGGPMAIEPTHLKFCKVKDGGFLLQGRARFDLKTEGKPFTSFAVEGIGFGLDGRIWFGDDGARSTTVTLNKQSHLGPTPAELKTVTLIGNPDAANPLTVRVNAQLKLSENEVIPPAPVSMDFPLMAGGGVANYVAPEVKVAPFTMNVGFPLGSPAMNAKITTQHQNSGGSTGNVPNLPGVRYTGDVDLALFGGNAFRAQFVLGYENKKSYFATRMDVPLGPSGVVIVPEIVSLYRISGGFAYNFGKEVFTESTTITGAKPDFKGETLLMAGLRLGSGDGFIYTLDGMLTIKSTGSPRVDFGSWLLERNPSGTPPLRGYLQFANGALDGRMWGGFRFLGGVAEIDLGQTEQNAACSLHVGGGTWHIYAGQRDGQRIVGRLMGNTTQSYLMLGKDVGLAIGGTAEWYMGVGSGNVGSAYAKGWMDMGLQVTPQPKLIGDFGAGLRAGACALGACVSAGVTANIHAEALPISLSASCCLDLPWPLGDICFNVRM